MPTFSAHVVLPTSAQIAYDWHARPGAFARLTPPWQDVHLISETPAPGANTILADGGRVELSVPIGPFRTRWVALHRDHQPGRAFVDVQESGPFARWEHQHRFEDITGGCTLTDTIHYDLGGFSALANGWVRRDLERAFAFRHARTRGDLERHAAFIDRPRLRVAVAGSTGLVGTALVPFLTTGGHQVVQLSRRAAPGRIAWNPDAGELSATALNDVDAVVHLGGETVAQPWTSAAKERIRNSRMTSTLLLSKTIAGMPRPPKVLIVASAIGYYGLDHQDDVCDESSTAGSGFLADICRDWEAACEPARQAGVRVVNVRIGMVLSQTGGALAKMLAPFRWGLGGPIGGGQQWNSWIHLDDLVDIIHQSIVDERLLGAVNAVTPYPVRQGEFAATLAGILHRPHINPLPRWAVSVLFGEMGHALLLASARVQPTRLTETGFRFRYSHLADALRNELGKRA